MSLDIHRISRREFCNYFAGRKGQFGYFEVGLYEVISLYFLHETVVSLEMPTGFLAQTQSYAPLWTGSAGNTF